MRYLTLAALLLTSRLVPGQSFEGKLIYTAEAGAGIEAVIYVKGDLLRIETATPKGPLVRLLDQRNGEVHNLVEKDGRKTAIKMHRSNKFAHESLSQRAAGEVATLERTEETKILHGYTCRKVTAKDGRSEGMAWVVEGVDLPLEDLLVHSSAYSAAPSPVHAALLGAGWVVELRELDLRTRQLHHTKTQLIPGPVAAEQFVIPAEYRVVDATDMRGLLKASRQK